MASRSMMFARARRAVFVGARGTGSFLPGVAKVAAWTRRTASGLVRSIIRRDADVDDHMRFPSRETAASEQPTSSKCRRLSGRSPGPRQATWI